MGIGTFSPDAVNNLQQRQLALERLKAIGPVWIGSDVPLENKIIAPASELLTKAKLVINKNALPNIEINRGTLASLDWSVRSFLAQSGIEIRFHHSNLSDQMIKDIERGENVPVPIDIINHGQRSVEIEGEAMRFFWVDDSKRLRKEELEEAVKSDFIIDGKEGKDWFLGDIDLKNNPKNGVCVVVNLQEKKFYIPSATEPLRIKSRKELPSVLKEIPTGMNLNFEIGETPKVKISPNIVAVINMGAYDSGQRHILSPLIDPGVAGHITGSEGHIRTETLNGLHSIEFFLYKKSA